MDLETGKKLYESEKTKNILIIKIYLIIKYILIFNKYIKEVFIILNLQIYINRIGGFFGSHILPDFSN